MEFQKLSENISLAVLPAKEPHICEGLKNINQEISKSGDFDLIIDFSKVEILTSSSLSNLAILHNWLYGCGHKLVLCNISFPTKCIFKVAGLESHFEFAEDRAAALEVLQRTTPSSTESTS